MEAATLKTMRVHGIILAIVALLGSACGDGGKVERSTALAELNRLPPPPGARLVATRNSVKHVSVAAKFDSALSQRQIADHYIAVMSRAGWQLCRETQVLDWGRDRGDRSVSFAKGELLGILFLANDPKRYGCKYELNVKAAKRMPWDKAGCG